MTLAAFITHIEINETPEPGISQPLVSLWWDRKGDWDRAHAIAQTIPTVQGRYRYGIDKLRSLLNGELEK